MKRILVFISMLLCLTAIADNGNVKCNQGNQTPLPPPKQNPWPADEASPRGRTSSDPNEIIGPEGYDSVRWVSINDVLNYTILFENDPVFATAAAQMVDVRFDFQEKKWMKGFGIGRYGFANMSFSVAEASNAYQQRIDLKDSLGYFVDLIGGIDVARQQGFWNFSTIDPETGYAPWQAEKGLLPVNDSTHVGEGFVTFQLKPYEDLKTGDTISIYANIVFDQNDTISTNRWCNKIDAGMPESKLTAEKHPVLPNVYNMKFSGKDDKGGSGIKHILVYLANHSGIYEEIDTVSVDSVLAFPVEGGKQYKLYSIAVDNTGNREPAKMEPDVILNFNLAPTDIALSDTIFQDDLAAGGYIGKLTTVDSEEEKSFTYALAEGDGAIHNDLFQITDDQLQIKNSFKCVDDSCFKVRISTTDGSGMSYSKPFNLKLNKVLVKPDVDTLNINICEGETCVINNVEYSKTGVYKFSKENEFMCDSLYVLNLNVVPRLEMPLVTIEDSHTLVSSAAKGNQWFKEDGTRVVGATEQKFTPEEDGVYYVAVSNGSCYSDPSQLYRIVLTDKMDLTMDLQEGWNWVSSNLSGENMKDAKKFISPIADYTNRLVGATSELTKDPKYGFVGSLKSLEPQQGYKLQMSQTTNHTWSGLTAKPETTSIKLHKGWNWIGYVPVLNQSIGSALTKFDASENTIIKCEDDFSAFANGAWTGSLEELAPGKGYMLYSDKETTFTYPVTRVFVVTNSLGSRRKANEVARAVAPWHYDEYKYPDNTTLIARLNVNGQQALDGAYSVGAFCDGECRGIGKYVDGLLFFTIHGTISSDKNIMFKAVENITGDELEIKETIKFKGQHTGTIAQPLVLNAKGGTTSIENVDYQYTVYPKPLRSRMYINGATETIKAVHVLSVNGQKCISVNGYSDDGIDVSNLVSGIYVVAIITDAGKTIYEKVLKANN